MIDHIAKVLEWVDNYGADKVFLVWFFLLYWRANKRNEKLQDSRLEDSKVALQALIEAKHVFTEMSKEQVELQEFLKDHDKNVQKALEEIKDLSKN